MLENHMVMIPIEKPVIPSYADLIIGHPASSFDNGFNAREFIRQNREFVYVASRATDVA